MPRFAIYDGLAKVIEAQTLIASDEAVPYKAREIATESVRVLIDVQNTVTAILDRRE